MEDHKAKIAGSFLLSIFKHLILLFSTCPILNDVNKMSFYSLLFVELSRINTR